MERPAELAYGLEDNPPASVLFSAALQQAGVVLVWIYPAIIIAREVQAGPAETAALFSMVLVACGLGTIIQAIPRWGIGSGFVAPATPANTHLVPSVLAAQLGGLPLVAGMTIAAGLASIAFARLLGRMRALMPPEVAGAVVFIIGIAVSLIGARMLLGGDPAAPPDAASLGVALITLCAAIALSVWGRGVLRWGCILIAMLAGTLAAALLGLPLGIPAEVHALPIIALPDLPRQGFAFDLALLPAFLIAALASALKTVGVVTTLQKLNDAHWIRPEPRSLAGGVTGDGLATALAGLLGTPGVNVSASNVAAQIASGVTSRRVAYATGALCLLLACFPRLAALLAQVPGPVIAATLIYSGGLMLASGMQLAASRLLDARRSLSVGLAIAAALTVEALPQVARWVPAGLGPLMSATAFGTLVAILLNAVLRLGVRRSVSLSVPVEGIAHQAVEDFVMRAGAAWGARRDVAQRAVHLLASCLDALAASGCARGPITATLGFDELRLDLRITWPGAPIELATRPPTADEMVDDPAAAARLAGFLLRRLSDRARIRHKDGTSAIELHLDH
jgi:NCS2 family nucleobase:cation symporter-2